jgi:hypothetical protein
MISDNNYLISISIFIFIFILLNFTNLINFLIYTELLWILIYAIFLTTSLSLDTNTLTSITKIILILASIEFVILIYLITQIKLVITTEYLNKKLNHINFKYSINKFILNL